MTKFLSLSSFFDSLRNATDKKAGFHPKTSSPSYSISTWRNFLAMEALFFICCRALMLSASLIVMLHNLTLFWLQFCYSR